METLDRLYYSFLNSTTRIILLEALDLTLALLPYLFTGILLTVLLKLYVTKDKIAKIFSKHRNSGIVLSSLFGVVSPLGSYVAIPMSVALLNVGVPLPVMIAFVVTSPLINPNLFILTAGVLGLEMAIMRVLSAFLIGLTAGYTMQYLLRKNFIHAEKIVRPGVKEKYDYFFGHETEKVTLKRFGIEFYKMTRYVSKYFFIAILLAAIIKISLSPQAIPRLFKGNEILSVIVAVVAGVPFYVCGGAAIPLVQALAGLGLSKGAILAFFISGPATKVSNLVVLYAMYRKTIFFHYFACSIIGAFLLGNVYNLIIFMLT